MSVAAQGLGAALAQQSGAMRFAVHSENSDRDRVSSAMVEAAAAVARVPHPDEPTGKLASFVSEVDTTEADPQRTWFWADISDMEDEPEIIEHLIAAVLEVLNTFGLDDVLEKTGRGAGPLEVITVRADQVIQGERKQSSNRKPRAGSAMEPPAPRWRARVTPL